MLIQARNLSQPAATPVGSGTSERRKLVVDQALDWIIANLEHFTPLGKATQLDEPKLKPFFELLLLGKLMVRYGWDRNEPRLFSLIDFAESILSHPSFEHGIRRSPMYDTFTRLRAYVDRETWRGPDPQKRREIQQIIDAGLMNLRELPPFQTMELLEWLEGGGFRHQLPDQSTLYRQTVAYRLPMVLNLPHFETYVITHVLFYLSDWGLGDPSSVLQDRLEDTCELVRLMLGMALLDRDWDLVAELLMCCRCLKRDPGSMADLAWQALGEAQTEQGNVPNTKKFDPGSPVLQHPEAGPRYEFDTTYHSTLVTILAGLLWSPVSYQG